MVVDKLMEMVVDKLMEMVVAMMTEMMVDNLMAVSYTHLTLPTIYSV